MKWLGEIERDEEEEEREGEGRRKGEKITVSREDLIPVQRGWTFPLPLEPIRPPEQSLELLNLSQLASNLISNLNLSLQEDQRKFKARVGS